MNKINLGFAVLVLALGACGNGGPAANEGGILPGNVVENDTPPPPYVPPEVPYGPEETMSGTYVTRFEHEEFNGCWLEMDRATYADFRRRFPGRDEHSGRFGSFRMEIVGRRSVDDPSRPPAYGHMGGSRCQIEATRIISASEIGHDNSAPDAPTDKPAPPTHGLSAGHDQARLDEIRQRIAEQAGASVKP